MRLAPELKLMAACCRWPPSAARGEAIRTSAAEPIDWDGFGRLVAKHRVEGLVHDGLKRAGVVPPAELDESLAAEASDIARRNLAFAAECKALNALLDEAGTDHLFIKGTTLNILAYGTLALKKACDIDLLVDPDVYERAVELVEARGYRCLVPGPDPARADILDWARSHKHTIWTRSGIILELHSSLVDNPPLLPGLSVRSPRQSVEIAPGIVLPTLATEILFAYLCAHGATHGWSRLKWLADVAALIKDMDEARIERLHARSVELGGGRSAGQALLLCSTLFGMSLPAGLDRALRGDVANRLLVGVALRTATLGGLGRELDDMVLGTAQIHLSYLLLDRGARYKWRQIGRSLLGESGEGLPWPRRLAGPFLRAPLWLMRRARTRREIAKRPG
ncbi:MAG: nucleotidyltransferase domain-containing protein [Allosphingosinicella sp.]